MLRILWVINSRHSECNFFHSDRESDACRLCSVHHLFPLFVLLLILLLLTSFLKNYIFLCTIHPRVSVSTLTSLTLSRLPPARLLSHPPEKLESHYTTTTNTPSPTTRDTTRMKTTTKTTTITTTTTSTTTIKDDHRPTGHHNNMIHWVPFAL